MKSALFVCIENTCRSQMAEGFFNKYAKSARAYSAGSRPAKEIDPTTVEVMKEEGIDLSGKKPKGIGKFAKQKFDVVVTMGCGDECPFVPGKRKIEWDIKNPKGRPREFYRKIRGEIEVKVQTLLEEFDE